MKENYLQNLLKQFQYYKILGEKTFDQLDEAALFIRPKPDSNSIAIIVKHLWGNMMSRWTDFITSDGEKEWRKRDEEFRVDFSSKAVMIQKWEEGWNCLFSAIESAKSCELADLVYIRNQGHTILEAFNRQLSHYAYHVGQIVYIGTLIKGPEWKSLSIPIGESKTYNDQKFIKGKHKGHFTDDFLDRN